MDYFGDPWYGPEGLWSKCRNAPYSIDYTRFSRTHSPPSYGFTGIPFSIHPSLQKWRIFGHKKLQKSSSITLIQNFSSPPTNIIATDLCPDFYHLPPPLDDAGSALSNDHQLNLPKMAPDRRALQVSSLSLLPNLILLKIQSLTNSAGGGTHLWS